MDRRRLASLVALVLAGSATIATSQPPPTPAATIEESLEGRIELSSDAPIAVQEFHLRLNGPTISKSGIPTVLFTPSAILASDELGAQVRLRVIGIGAATPAQFASSFRSAPGPESPQRVWYIPCPQPDSCEGHFGLVVEWVDPDSGAAATVDWHLDADIGVWTSEAAGSAIVDFATETIDAVAKPALDIASARGESVRMDATHRLAQWRVTMRLDDSTLSGRPVWPNVVTARLTPTSTVVTPPEDGNAREPCALIDGPDDLRQVAFDPRTTGCPGGVEFEPFHLCVPDQECIVEYLVGLWWADWRLEAAVDAGWSLDVRSIGADGTELPISVDVEPVPQLAMAVATATGTLSWSKGQRDEHRYLVSVSEQSADDPILDGTRLPTYGVLRATLTSTGSTPLPEDFTINFGKHGGEQRLTLNSGKVATGFIVNDDSPCRVGADEPCEIHRGLAAGFSDDRLPNGSAFTVTWELEIGVGLVDPDAGIEIIDITPTPSPP